MVYVKSLNLAFLWIPRCGGRSVYRALKTARLGTLTKRGNYTRHGWRVGRRNCLIEHARVAKGMRLAVFVRDPIRRYQSMWSWHAKRRKDNQPDPIWQPENYYFACLVPSDFNATMRNVIEREPGLCTRTYEWYCGPEGAERVDYIGRTEHLARDLDFIMRDCGYIGPSLEVLRINRTLSGRVEWEPDVLAEVKRLEAPAIRRFYGDGRVKFC